MTNVVVVIDALGDNHVVSADVIDADTWNNKLTQIGTCELLIDNVGDQWGNQFEPNNTIDITIGGIPMFAGFVDDVMPTLGKRGVITNLITVKGRDYGRYLTDFYYTKNYKDQASATIIQDIINRSGCGLLYNGPAPPALTVKYNCQRTKLGDAFNEISALAGGDYYIDITGTLQYFTVGDATPVGASGVTLKCEPADITNNLLSFEEYEEIGFDIKNVIDIHAGSVKDHWTEETAAGWVDLLGGATAFTDDSTVFMYGTSSIKVVAGDDDETFGLDFSGIDGLYGYKTIDMTKYGQAKVVFRPKDESTGDFSFRPVLVDGDGDVITFTRKAAGQGSKGYTEEHNAYKKHWSTLSFPIGDNASTVVKVGQTSTWWHYTTRDTIIFAGLYTSAALVQDNGAGRGTITADGGTPYAGLVAGENIQLSGCEDAANNGIYTVYSATDTVITLTTTLPVANIADTSITILTVFNWDNVVKIGFQLETTAGMDTIYIDALYLPSVEARCSTTEGAASILAYGTRMLSEFRKQLKSQKELDDYAAKVLAFREDPIQKFKAVAIGQTDTKYVSQTVKVEAVADYGVDANYIIVTLHHSLHNNRNTRGWDYITEYDLVEQDTDPNRVLRGNNYLQAYLLQQARDAYEQQRAMMDDEYWLGEVMTGLTPQIQRGAAFPTDMNDGDEFFLTGNYTDPITANEYYGPALYKYDETAVDWLRDPIVIHRDGDDPPAGGEVHGDTLHRIDQDKWYRYDSGVPGWVQIDFAATTISGTLSSSQLKKGIQPFDSAVFFYPIRASANSVVTFDIDVDDAGSGKTTITASALTPFDAFTAGDELIVQGCEDPDNNSITKIIESVGGGGLSITLTNMVGGVDTATDETCIVSARDAVRWVGANPAVWFGDGTNRQVVTGDVNGLALGSHWIYFSTADTDAHTTNVYANAVGDTVGIICRLEITSDKEPLIMPVYSRGGSMTLDFLGAGAVDTLVLTSEQIIGKDFRTRYNVGVAGLAGVRLTNLGVETFGAGLNMFYTAGDTNPTGYLQATNPGIRTMYILSTANYGGCNAYIWANKILYLRGDDGTTSSITFVTDAMFNTKGQFTTNLRIPAGNADPVALISGDIWLREDL